MSDVRGAHSLVNVEATLVIARSGQAQGLTLQGEGGTACEANGAEREGQCFVDR